ncbi:hypothetical protein HK097_002856 [Rhizophlyctis rosea]|uniref:Secreted protein n=1 Tax=Rhizophlyctis rosea TaxID=64517 RepID=A0AAD5X0E5_9FUNG|nr:hypothetical protein HK097_002856 [Rhizophlyctis rosea]
MQIKSTIALAFTALVSLVQAQKPTTCSIDISVLGIVIAPQAGNVETGSGCKYTCKIPKSNQIIPLPAATQLCCETPVLNIGLPPLSQLRKDYPISGAAADVLALLINEDTALSGEATVKCK